MPKKRGWKLAASKSGELHPKKKRLTDLTGDSGPGDTICIPTNRTKDCDCQMELAGDTVLLNNSYKYCLCAQNHTENSLRMQKESQELSKSLSTNSSEKLLNQVTNLSKGHLLTAQSSKKLSVKSQFSDNVLEKSTAQFCMKWPLKCNDKTCGNIISKASSSYPFHAVFLKFGSFHQNDERFKVETRGNQCTCNALMFLALGFNKQDATIINLDTVLNLGDELYGRTVQELKRNGKYRNMLLTVDEIPLSINTNQAKLQVTKKNTIVGLGLDINNCPGILSLHQALPEAFKASSYLMLWIGAICSALWYHSNTFYLFDSHSHSRDTLSGPDGKSVLIGFSSIENLINYLYDLYTSMHIDLQEQFEILPVSFLCMNTTSILNRQIADYFKDQTHRRQEQINTVELCDVPFYSKTKSAYMKIYMQKRRKERTFREKERDAKRLARTEKGFKQAELDGKRTAREDEEFRSKERKIELDKKRLARENLSFKCKERNKKRTAREDEEFRNKERKRELDAKKAAREDEEFKRSECDAKRTAREDEDFRNKERKRELDAKRLARRNLAFKHAERDKKRIARESVGQQLKDAKFKKIERENEDYRKEEARKDLIRKKKYRSSALNLEKERVSKQNSRNMNPDRDRNCSKASKKRRRQDQEIVEHEQMKKKKKVHGCTLLECIKKFEEKIAKGPAYVCTCCQQTWFRDNVENVKSVKILDSVQMCTTKLKSVDDIEWICRTCLHGLKEKRIPRLSVANKMGFPEKPKELQLYPLEERLISLRIPFMQIRQLPRGGQFSVKGNVVNVPVDIQPTINSLPRTIDKSGTIAVKLKKKLQYNKCDFSENVRPSAVMYALHYLMNTSDMYKVSGIQLNDDWINEIDEKSRNDSNDIKDANHEELEEINSENVESDHFSEVDDTDMDIGNTDTLLDEISDESDVINSGDKEYIFAPGEGQRPLSLYRDDDAEYLSFPTIFCGQKRPDNKERSVPVHYTDIVKWELRSVDRRVAQSVPNIFFKLKKIQLKNIADKVNLALRRCKSEGKKWRAKDILDPSTVNDLVRLDEGYFIFRTLRNSPVYLEKRKKDVFAMIRQLGLPTWFGSFSSADTKWLDLLKVLGNLNDGKNYSEEELEHMSWHEKTRLVQRDPVTCSRFFDYRVQQFIRIVLKSNFHPIGKISYYFYRVEFQQRGSPHIHILIWIENALIYKKDSEEKIVEYIDKHVSCSKTIEFEDLVKLQVHKHSKTCRKKGHPVCRFGFPLPPMQNTVILEPLESEVDKYKNLYNEMQKKINTLHDYDGVEDMSFDDFIHNFLETNLEEYIKIIRSNLNGPKVFLARKPSEVRVNAYMKIVLSAWKANHDLQFVLDPYACAMYIVSYISKSQKGMSALLDQAAKEARQGNLDLKRQVRHIGNYFTNSVETCAQEAIYLTLQLPLTKATRKVVFINTSSSNKRTFLLKQTSALEKLAPDSTDIEAGNDIKRYSMRPKVLENWCLADYISQLDIKFPKQANNEIENDYEENCTEDEESEMEDESEIGKKICIKLKNGVTIKQRQTKSFKVIRYVRFNKKTDSENFYRERLMLFYPWRNETTDLKNQYETYEEMYMTVRRIIENKAKQYEHNAEELDKAMEQAEEDCAQYDAIAPGTQQRELDDLEESVEEAEQYIHFNPDRAAEHKCYDIGQDIGICQKTLGPTSIAVRMNDADYHQLIRSLNIKQREFYHHVVTWIKTKDEPLYAFLTGGAGVGKSVVVRALYQGLHRYLCSKEGEDPDDVRILLCAPTGKSAYNINGLTLHNAFHVQGNKCKGAKLANQRISFDVLNTLRMKYRNLTVIMIDEISMVGNEMFSIIESRAKKIKENKKTFGGISVIVIGDLLQLQPVGEGWVFSDLNKGISSLAPNLWKELFYMHELTDIMRQKDDMDFARLLNRLRENKITENDLSILESRIIKENDHLYPSGATHLFISNKLVDDHNKEIIRNLQTQKVTIKAFDVVQANVSPEVKKILISNLPQNAADTANLSKEVEIAVDMKYDFTVNVDIADGLTNGASCEVKMIENKQKDRTSRPSIVWVKFDEDNIGARARKRYSSLYGPNIDKSWTPIFDIKRSFIYKWKTYERIQFPLRAAAAKTIHKSQGCTLDEVVVKLTSKNPNKHIHYVALSRVTSLNGLHILDLNSSKIGVSNVVMEENKRLRTEAVLELCYKPLYTIGNSFLKFVFNNCRSLHAHFKDVKHEPNIINADVIGLAESRLVSLDLDEDYSLPGFAAPIRMDQITANSTTRPYHGLLLYVKNDFFIENVVKFSSTLVEFIMADIICGRGHMQAVVLYKSPECGIEQLKDILISELLPTLDIDCNILIMGDFNLDIRSGNQNFLKFMEKKFICKQEISKVTTNYGSILDLFFVKVNQDVDIESDVVEAYWSDHKIVYTAVDL